MSNKHRFIIDGQRAGGFTRCRTYTACYFRKVVRRMKYVTCLLPASLVYHLVELGNPVLKRASCACAVTKRYAAIHTPCGLLAELVGTERKVHLPEVINALLDRTMSGFSATILQKAVYLTHRIPPRLQVWFRCRAARLPAYVQSPCGNLWELL